MTLISILIPVYNGVEYLEECLNSVINQTYNNWEVIIGINGHLPTSSIIITINDIVDLLINNNINKEVLKNKIKVRYFDTKGKNATILKMKDEANGDYLAILDVDDYWLPQKLEKQLPYINNYDVIGTQCKYFGLQSNSPNIPFGDLDNYDFLNNNPIINSSALIKKDCATWDINEFYDDYDLWLQLYHKKKKFFNINEILVMHRIHNTSSYNININKCQEELVKLKFKWSKIYSL